MGLSSQPYLNLLQNLNLYTPTNVYNLDNNSLNNSISTIASLVTNNSVDFSNTLLNRVLGDQTPLQQVATQELSKAMAVRFAKNLRTNLLPTVSLNGIFNIDINKPLSYWNISGKDRQSLSDIIKVMSGYESISNPVPLISSTFTEEDSNNWLKTNRGQGQKDTYLSNVTLNKYSDEITDGNGVYGKDNLNSFNIKKGLIPESLLSKTNFLLNDNSLIDGEPSAPSDFSNPGDNLHPSAVVFKYLDYEGNLKLIPKGDGTTTNDDGTKFLRTFNKTNPYDSTNDLMKFYHGTAGSNSVLQTVFPNIAPQEKDVVNGNLVAKNLMFSIENLAYKGNTQGLKPSEKSIDGGRIMWFAPYDIQVNENSSVGWDKVNFIGRSEAIHTYNGSERSCNISFTLIADYPAELNNNVWRSKSNNEYNKYFRQNNPKDFRNLSDVEFDKISVKKVQQIPVVKPKLIEPPVKCPYELNNALKYYFDNDDYSLKIKLTQDNTLGTGQKSIDKFNSEFNKLVEFLNSEVGQNYTVIIDGSSSALFTKQYNKVLSFLRAKSIYDRLITSLQNIDNYRLDDYNTPLKQQVLPTKGQSINEKFNLISHGESNVQNTTSTAKTIKVDVVDRYAALYLKYNPKLDNKLKPLPTVRLTPPVFDTQLQPKKVVKPKEEDFYFERYKMEEDTQLSRFNPEDLTENLLKSYANNIKYFMPIFHSQTPIDLNERVTFLQQCTRQGGSMSDTNSNSIFGRPPVCILRLGDFFNTKIIINNIALDYEPLIWDTNPEGIGMQPMICRVNMNCMIIGGSDLTGPINRIQNALDYNYYANTSVYNKIARNASIKQLEENKDQVLKQNVDDANKINKL